MAFEGVAARAAGFISRWLTVGPEFSEIALTDRAMALATIVGNGTCTGFDALDNGSHKNTHIREVADSSLRAIWPLAFAAPFDCAITFRGVKQVLIKCEPNISQLTLIQICFDMFATGSAHAVA